MKKLIAVLLLFVLVFALSSVAYANAKVVSPEIPDVDVPPDDPGPPSPQTGESVNVVWFVIAAVAFLAVAFFCVKKLILSK